jgi:PleD family two-component response regulator
MPAPDGAALARQIRASRVNASTVIVMITGEQDRKVMGRAFEAGVEFFLFKPVERNKLLKLIRATEGSIERELRRFTRVRLRSRVSLESGNERLEGTWRTPRIQALERRLRSTGWGFACRRY